MYFRQDSTKKLDRVIYKENNDYVHDYNYILS